MHGDNIDLPINASVVSFDDSVAFFSQAGRCYIFPFLPFSMLFDPERSPVDLASAISLHCLSMFLCAVSLVLEEVILGVQDMISVHELVS